MAFVGLASIRKETVMYLPAGNDKMVRRSIETQFEHEALLRAGAKGLPTNSYEAVVDFFSTAFKNLLAACR